ncbi:hypothetical protein RhiirA4_448959 [Rhizophagus irregularis]|uniref:Uncharacterized protein n=1 Tax=Rhizophagus irregularis TaxID=588596 RepID=A0A2I1FZM2_9GLOM|nr:hypothetical protein RhiirA4_440307 [Rhizophagus irregularis]PKY57283.1 hypothetical protein RhiirA4_448959 [Rhizophagus irregularis]
MDEEKCLKELKDRRRKVARNFRLKNLKKIADKNKALHKIAKKNTLQAIIFSIVSILFGSIFIFLIGNSSITKIVENAVVGIASLMSLFSNLRSFMTPSTDDDSIDIKFSEVCDESVELSLKITDEDDIRNTENTIETWNFWLLAMKSFYTGFTIFSSLLFIVFIILDLTSLQEKNAVPINMAIIIFGVVSLFFTCLIHFSLKIFTLTSEGGKDIERLLSGIKIHIKRNTARDLEQLKDHYIKFVYNSEGLLTILSNKFPSNDLIKFLLKLSEISRSLKISLNKLIKCITRLPKILLLKIKFIRELSEILKFRSQKKKEHVTDLTERLTAGRLTGLKDAVNEVPKPAAGKDIIASWIRKLFSAMEGLDFILQKDTNSQSELNMKKLRKTLSLKELVEIILEDQEYPCKTEPTKLSVDYHILRELYGASKGLLNIIKNENEKKKESGEIEEEIEEEFSKISKKLEVINQIIEKNKTKTLLKEFTEITHFTGKLFEELGVIKVKLKYINRRAEYLNNLTDPASADVDELRKEIPKILKIKDLEKHEYYKKWNEIQMSKQKNTNHLEKITNLPLRLYKIEKELSRTPKLLKEIDQKIETPILDMGYAKIVHGHSDDKLGEIEKKLFEMYDNIRQYLMNEDDNDMDMDGGKIDKEFKTTKEFSEEFIEEFSEKFNSIEKFSKKFIEELSKNSIKGFSKDFNEKFSIKFKSIEEFSKKFIEEFSNKLIEKFSKKFIEELSKELIEKKLIENFSGKFNTELTENSGKIETLYEIIDKLKKKASEKSKKSKKSKESKESKESTESTESTEKLLKFLERLSNELHQISIKLILKELLKLRNNEKNKNYTKLHKGLIKLDYASNFKDLHKLFKEINQKTFKSIKKNYSAHLADDKYFFKHLYYEILDSIEEVERYTRLKPISSYIDFGKHYGTYLFHHLIPDGKKRWPYKEANKKLIRCYYRLGELLFSDNNGENAPEKVTDLQHRKAENIYDLYNKMLLIFNDVKNVNNNPLDIIEKIKSKHAATIFALSNDDVKYLISEIIKLKHDKFKNQGSVDDAKLDNDDDAKLDSDDDAKLDNDDDAKLDNDDDAKHDVYRDDQKVIIDQENSLQVTILQ